MFFVVWGVFGIGLLGVFLVIGDFLAPFNLLTTVENFDILLMFGVRSINRGFWLV